MSENIETSRRVMKPEDAIRASLRETGRLHEEFPEAQIALIAKAAGLMAEGLRSGRKIIWFGNGGSATQSQHMAGEFVGRFQRERRSLPSLSLTENMASVTAIGNDYAFDQIFSRQLEGLAQPGDIAVGLSTSGNSSNVIRGLEKARELTLPTIGLTGGTGGRMTGLCDVCVIVPSSVTARIQEVHLTIGHILCGLVEEALASASRTRDS